MKLEGKNALITGAGSGLGAEIARVFAAEGAFVLVTDIDEGTAAGVAEECGKLAGSAQAARCDVADSRSVADAFRAMDATGSDIDILVNNAGIIHTDPELIDAIGKTSMAQVGELMAGGPITTHSDTIERITDEMFDRMLRIHLYGTFYCTREALPRMRKHGRGGRIINMGSIMGSASLTGVPDYCAAKGGIMAFTRATAREAASYGVLVNSIAPGFIETPLLDPLPAEQLALITSQVPQGRLGQADEIAAAALFLAGPDGSYMTGQSLSPNGGIYMSQ